MKIESKEQALKLLSEAHKRADLRERLIATCFPEQKAFVLDNSKFLAALCTRQAGKSFSAALKLILTCLDIPKCNCAILGITRQSVSDIYIKDIFHRLNDEYQLGLKFRELPLKITFPNGSVIRLGGVDDNEKERNKLLGQKYAAIVIDESATFSIDVYDLIFKHLLPTTVHYDGQIIMIGTPDNDLNNYFYKVTKDPDDGNGNPASGWSVHKWSIQQNPYESENWKKILTARRAENPLYEATKAYQQHYLGKWVIDDGKLIFKFNSVLNAYDGLLPEDNYTFILGIDLGHSPDATAFVVLCYGRFSPYVYIVESHKEYEMDLTAVANKIFHYKRKYIFSKMVIDAANKQGVEEIRNRYRLHLTPADKRDKLDMINIMNDEFIQGKIKIDLAANQDLVKEYSTVCWDEKQLAQNIKQEKQKQKDDLVHASLYGFRHCRNYNHRPTPKTDYTIDEIMDQKAEEYAAKMVNENKKAWWQKIR